jgi:hypothetical protein
VAEVKRSRSLPKAATKRGASRRKRLEQLGVGVLSHVPGNLVVILSDGFIELSNGFHQMQHGQTVSLDHRLICHQRQGRPHQPNPPILPLVTMFS